jgi:pilus assembly protein CpaB
MKRARLIGMAIAAIAAVGAMLLVYAILSRPQVKTQKVQVNTVEVLVAKADLKVGDLVRAADMKWQAWPTEAASTGYITKSSDPDATKKFDGSIARSSFLANEPIKASKLIKANEGGVMAAILPAGKRAISTKIEEFTGVAGFIMPNDRVDVIKTGKEAARGNSKPQFTVETILHNIRVLAIGQVIENQDTKDGKKNAIAARTATLELTPAQAERLALERATNDSTISLSLLSLAEAQGAPSVDETPIKKEENTGVKMLRYGTWSRVYSGN